MIITTVQHISNAKDEKDNPITSVVTTAAFYDQHEQHADKWVAAHEAVYRIDDNFFVTKTRIKQ